MEYKQFINLELKADDILEGDGSTIIGYGSVFGNVDQGGDVVAPDAFTKSLETRKPVMLFNHNPNEVVGVWNSVVPDEKGLKVEGKLANTAKGNELKELIKIGAVTGLSVGYRIIDSAYLNDNRLLKNLDLWEISIVAFPMNLEAQVESIKSQNNESADYAEFLELINKRNRILSTKGIK